MKHFNYQQKNTESLLVRENALLSYKVHQMIVDNQIKGIKKDFGIYFTPEHIVDFMVNLIDKKSLSVKKDISILEPACGLAQFLIGIRRNFPSLFDKAKLYGVESNQEILRYLTNLEFTKHIKLINGDYLLWDTKNHFDLIIGNPPYGIPGQSSHYPIKIDHSVKNKYKKIYETWYGKYNLYGAFIEKSIKLLNPNGQLIFIVPATFMILDEFRKLRKFLSENGSTAIIYMGIDAFKPEADVATVVLNFFKTGKKYVELLEFKNNRISLIRNIKNWHGDVLTLNTSFTEKLESICSYILGDLYDIKISPRTPEIKKSPFVIRETLKENSDYLPILNGRNLKCGKIIYDNLTGYCIKKANIKKLRSFFGHSHIVVGLGFREDGRVAAAYDDRSYPWMGDVYHLLPRSDLFAKKFVLTEKELVDYLNSDYLKKYVKELYREITYHLSITQLKNLPIPNKKEWEKIKKKGFVVFHENYLNLIIDNIDDIEKVRKIVTQISIELSGEY